MLHLLRWTGSLTLPVYREVQRFHTIISLPRPEPGSRESGPGQRDVYGG
jgi:hypothetical protein